jgi:hypothetical protein
MFVGGVGFGRFGGDIVLPLSYYIIQLLNMAKCSVKVR